MNTVEVWRRFGVTCAGNILVDDWIDGAALKSLDKRTLREPSTASGHAERHNPSVQSKDCS
jgi:hypothetical protein